jgi:hypothetical protein
VDTELPGRLRVASDNRWYLEDGRGAPFHWRGYDLHVWLWCGRTPAEPCFSRITQKKSEFVAALQQHAVGGGYNVVMLDGSADRLLTESAESWWLGADRKRFNLAVWRAWDEVFGFMKANRLYGFFFAGMIYQGAEYPFAEFQVFLRYFLARVAPYYNLFGYSPTWEWGWYDSTWTAADVTQVMEYVQQNNPFPTLLTAHDSTDASFATWMDFAMRQNPCRTIFDGNTRVNSFHGGVQPPFDRQPVVGSEDLWETPSGDLGQPRNADEVRRGAWGEMMAGVLPLYSEWGFYSTSKGSLPGEAGIIRMYDFFHCRTRYREYAMLNSLVSAAQGQICSGIAGREYLVYDTNGGAVSINLAAVSSSTRFTALWFDPKDGARGEGGSVSGGAVRTLISPFAGDSVLLLSTDPVSCEAARPMDFDGDRRADLSVYWPPNGTWYLSRSTSGFQFVNWGNAKMWPAPGDYDGDGMTDLAVFSPSDNLWLIRQSRNGALRQHAWGFSGVIPVPADYDGDGKTDPAVYDRRNGNWHILKSGGGTRSQNWGWSAAVPAPGDYDGDGVADIAVYFPAAGQWYVLESRSGAPRQQQWGWSEALPVPEDYDGDGRTDIAVYHPAGGMWFIRQSGSNDAARQAQWGWSEAMPVPCDFDGDGAADIAVYHRAAGNWHVRYSGDGESRVLNWGWSETQPVLAQHQINRLFGLVR